MYIGSRPEARSESVGAVISLKWREKLSWLEAWIGPSIECAEKKMRWEEYVTQISRNAYQWRTSKRRDTDERWRDQKKWWHKLHVHERYGLIYGEHPAREVYEVQTWLEDNVTQGTQKNLKTRSYLWRASSEVQTWLEDSVTQKAHRRIWRYGLIYGEHPARDMCEVQTWLEDNVTQKNLKTRSYLWKASANRKRRQAMQMYNTDVTRRKEKTCHILTGQVNHAGTAF